MIRFTYFTVFLILALINQSTSRYIQNGDIKETEAEKDINEEDDDRQHPEEFDEFISLPFCQKKAPLTGVFSYNNTVFVLSSGQSKVLRLRRRDYNKGWKAREMEIKTMFGGHIKDFRAGFSIDEQIACRPFIDFRCNRKKSIYQKAMVFHGTNDYTVFKATSILSPNFEPEDNDTELSLPFNIKRNNGQVGSLTLFKDDDMKIKAAVYNRKKRDVILANSRRLWSSRAWKSSWKDNEEEPELAKATGGFAIDENLYFVVDNKVWPVEFKTGKYMIKKADNDVWTFFGCPSSKARANNLLTSTSVADKIQPETDETNEIMKRLTSGPLFYVWFSAFIILIIGGVVSLFFWTIGPPQQMPDMQNIIGYGPTFPAAPAPPAATYPTAPVATTTQVAPATTSQVAGQSYYAAPAASQWTAPKTAQYPVQAGGQYNAPPTTAYPTTTQYPAPTATGQYPAQPTNTTYGQPAAPAAGAVTTPGQYPNQYPGQYAAPATTYQAVGAPSAGYQPSQQQYGPQQPFQSVGPQQPVQSVGPQQQQPVATTGQTYSQPTQVAPTQSAPYQATYSQ